MAQSSILSIKIKSTMLELEYTKEILELLRKK